MNASFINCRIEKTRFTASPFAVRVFFFLFLVFISPQVLAETPTLKKLLNESIHLLQQQETKAAIEKLDQVLLLSPDHPEANFRKGQALLLTRKANQGLEMIWRSTRLAPENVRFSLYLGRIYTKQGQIEKAIAEYQRVLDTGVRDKKISEVEMLLSLATGRSLAMKGEADAALLIFNGLLLDYPKNPQILFNVGNVYMQMKRIKEAEKIFLALYESGVKNKIVNMSLAKIYERTNRPELALKQLKSIMDLKSNDKISKNATVQYYLIQGRQSLKRRQWAEAIKFFQLVANIDSKRTEAYFQISMANLQLGNTEIAEKGFLSVLQITPEDYSTRLNLGIMYFDSGKTDQAKTEFQYIIDRDKSKRYAVEAKKRMNLLHSLLADKALKSGNIEAGLAEYEQALSYFSANTKASFTRGMIFVKQKKYAEAQKEFESVIQFSPKNIQARVNLGNIYEKQTLFSEAAEQYEIVVQLDKKGKAGRFAASKWKITKGRGLWKEKRLTESEKIFEEVTQEQPNNSQAFAFLGILQSSKGKLRKAARSYQRVLDLRPTNYAIKILLGKVYEQLGLDSLAANEYRSIIFAGGRIPQVPEAEQRLAAVEARLSGFSNMLSYSYNYDSNLNLNDDFPIDEIRSNLALNFNYAMKVRDDLSFSLGWSPTYSAYHFIQTDYLISVLQSFIRYGSPNNNWNFAFTRQDQDSLVNSTALSRSTLASLSKSKKIFSAPILNLSPNGFDGEDIATTVNVNGGFRQISAFTGTRLKSILGTLSLSLSQQIRWGVTANVGYVLGLYRNLKDVESYGGGSRVEIDTLTGLETVQVNETLIYSSDDFEYNSHAVDLSLRKTLAPGFIGNLRVSGAATGYTNIDSGAFARGESVKRLNLALTLTPSVTYMFFKDIRFVVSGTAQKNISSLPVGLSGGLIQGDNQDPNLNTVLEAIASFQSTSLGNYTRFSVDATFIMDF